MERKHIIICGPAGSGKTTLLRSVLSDFQNLNVVCCAPTHQAKSVMQEMTSIPAFTIHSILRIHPDTYEDQMDFVKSGDPEIGEVQLLVLDEGSMLDTKLFNIMMESIPHGCLIIALADPYQLQPPKHEPGVLSPIFFDQRFERILLTDIVRQAEDNPIIEVATAIRKQGSDIYSRVGADGTGVIPYNSISSFMAKYFSMVKYPEDTLKHKIVAYTNGVVDDINGLVRKHIYNTEEPVVVGELLVMQEPVYKKMSHKGITISELMFHNGETVKVLDIMNNQENVGVFALPNFKIRDLETDELSDLTVKFYNLKCQAMTGADPITYAFDVIYDEDSLVKLNEFLTAAGNHYKRMKSTMTAHEMKKNWTAFWALKSRFKSVKGSAACTIHKSQGSTYENAFIITTKLKDADPRIARQLRYVATTRAKIGVHYI